MKNIDIVLKINGEYKHIKMIFNNVEIKDENQNEINIKILKNNYKLEPCFLIDNKEYKYSDYKNVLPLNLLNEIIIEQNYSVWGKDDLLNLKMDVELSNYYDKNLVRNLFNEIINNVEEEIEADEYYSDRDYDELFIVNVSNKLNELFKNISSNLEKIFILLSMLNYNYRKIYYEIYSFIK